jgi:hypothetical protein
MEAVPKQPRLQRRGSRWFLRAKVPSELVKVIGKREIRKALGTSVYAEALDRLRVASCEVDAIFAEARRRTNGHALASGSINPVAGRGPRVTENAVQITALSDAELRQIVLDAFADWERRAVEMRLAQPADDHEREAALLTLAEEEALVSGSLAGDSVAENVAYHANYILAARDIIVEGGTRHYRLVLDLTQRALTESTRRERERYRGVYAGNSFDHLFNGIDAYSVPQAERMITLDSLIERFKADPGRAGRRNKTLASYEFTFRMLREVIGTGTPVRRITREVCRRLRDLLTALPPNATKRFPKMTLAQAAEHAKAHGLPPLNDKTAQKHLAQTSALFRWAVAEEFMPSNPAERLTVASGGPKRKARRPIRSSS